MSRTFKIVTGDGDRIRVTESKHRPGTIAMFLTPSDDTHAPDADPMIRLDRADIARLTDAMRWASTGDRRPSSDVFADEMGRRGAEKYERERDATWR